MIKKNFEEKSTMYNYPLTFTFPAFAVSPQITVKDARGSVILNAGKKLLSSKEEINVTRNSQPAYSIISQESRITDIPSNWDIKNASGDTLAIIDDDFLSAIDTSKFIPNSAGSMLADMEIHRALNLRSIPMYWINDLNGSHMGFVAPDKNSLMAMQLPLQQYIRQMPALFFRLITPTYYIRLHDETMMVIKKQRTLMVDTYILEARGKFTEEEEPVLINSALLALVYERNRLKDLYS